MRSRDGFTMVELIIVTVLAVIILTAVLTVFLWQGRAGRQAVAASNTQNTLRTGMQVLQQELREVSASGGDISAAAPESLRIRALRKVAFVCSANPVSAGGAWVGIDNVGGTAIAAGDSVLVFADGASTTSMTDDAWRPDSVRAENGAVGCTSTAAFSGALSRRAIRLNSTTLASGVYSGAVVRSFETLTYGIFDDGGTWVLGRRGADGTVAALVGPLSQPDSGGLRFRYYDASGNAISDSNLAANLANIRRIGIFLKGRAPMSGRVTQPYTDSLVSSVYLRGH